MDATDVHDEATLVAAILARTGRGNGDDAAVLRVGASPLCVSTDATWEGVHAPHGTAARLLGRRAAARALSDLAAMGAMPAGVTCALHVPAGRWADALDLVEGLVERAHEQNAELAGGDVCRIGGSALGVTVTVLGRRAGARRDGFVPRAGARPGDAVVVTGRIGAAGAALASGATTEPPDRIRAGVALAPFVHAMLDLSDGVARDATNLARASAVDLQLVLDELPLAAGVDDPLAACASGDDYELLATIPHRHLDAARAALDQAAPGTGLTVVGRVVDGSGEVHASLGGASIEPPRGFIHE